MYSAGQSSLFIFNMTKYSKIVDAVCTNYVTYYKHGSYESASFNVRYDVNGNIDYCSHVSKLVSDGGKFIIGDKETNSTEQEYNTELKKLVQFLQHDYP